MHEQDEPSEEVRKRRGQMQESLIGRWWLARDVSPEVWRQRVNEPLPMAVSALLGLTVGVLTYRVVVAIVRLPVVREVLGIMAGLVAVGAARAVTLAILWPWRQPNEEGG